MEEDTSNDTYFRQLHPEDVESMKRLCRECFPVEYDDRWYKRLLSGDDGVFTLGAFPAPGTDDTMIGLIVGERQHLYRLEGEYGMALDEVSRGTTVMYVTIFGVSAPYRRRGIGRKLMDALIDYVLQGTNDQLIYLHVESTNNVAVLFYKKVGFKFFCRDVGYYRIENNPADGLVYIMYTNGGKEYAGTVRSWCRRNISNSSLVTCLTEFYTFIKELFTDS